MADPFRAQQPDRVPDGVRAGGLTGVRDAVQPDRPGRVEVRCELRAWHPDLRAAQAEADQAVRPQFGGDPGGLGRRGQAASPGMSKHQRSTMPSSRSAASRASSMASRNASAGMPRCTERVRRDGQLGVADLPGRHVAGHLVGQHPDVRRVADQVHHGQVHLDEVREVPEGEVVGQQLRVGRHPAAGCRAASSATMRGEAEPTWCTCSSALGSPAMKSVRSGAAVTGRVSHRHRRGRSPVTDRRARSPGSRRSRPRSAGTRRPPRRRRPDGRRPGSAG